MSGVALFILADSGGSSIYIVPSQDVCSFQRELEQTLAVYLIAVL
jgi:hypothetical protein